ncbi:MAG: HAD-IA family hydrolase [Candidatus Micrarchaeota archaeon]
MFRSDYWTGVMTAIIFVAALFTFEAPFDNLNTIALWLLISYLVSLFIYPYFKLLFFRKAVILDFVGVVSAGTADDYYKGVLHERRGMRQLINRLKKNNKVVLFTNNNWEAHEPFSRRMGLNSLFDFEFASSIIGMKKPDAQAYKEICRRIWVSPQNAVMVDDQPENLDGAKKAGLGGIHFQSLEQCEKALHERGYQF